MFKVEDIENKIDHLVEMYMEDRNRLNVVPVPPQSPTQNCYTPPPPPPSTPTSNVYVSSLLANTMIKPKSIISSVSEKQASEPASPKYPSKGQIQRGNSDLSQRIVKKRVTLRHSLDTCNARSLSAGINRPVNEAQRSAKSDSSIGCIMLASATSSAPAIKLQTDVEPTNQTESKNTLLSSEEAESIESEAHSEGTIGTEAESMCISDEIENIMGKYSSDFEFIDDFSVDSSRKNSQESAFSYRLTDTLVIPEGDPGNESDCDLSTTTVVQAETEALLKPTTSDSKTHTPKYYHHPHHGHHHPHHYKSHDDH